MYNLSNFCETLNELIAARGVTQVQIAAEAGVAVSCISVYSRGLQAPYLDTLVKLADYLLGLTDNFEERQFNPCPPFAERLAFMLKKDGNTAGKIVKSGISKSCFYAWKRGESLPSAENLVALAEAFGCSVDFLIGRE